MAGWKDTIQNEPDSHWKDSIANDQAAPAPADQVGSGEAAFLGGMQGLTFGLSDEAIGGIRAGKDYLTSDASLADIKDLYQQEVDAQRAKEKAAEQQHPYLYKGSELGGGLLIPLGAAGKAVTGAKELSAFQKILAGSKAASQVGAGLGALTGFGKSEGNVLDNPLDVAKNTAIGGVGGAILGGGLGALGSTLGVGLEKAAEGTGATGIVAQSLSRGLEGENLLNSNTQAKKLYGLIEEHGEETLKPGIEKIVDRMGKIQSEARKDPALLEQYSQEIYDAAHELEGKLSSVKNREVQMELQHLIGTIDDSLMGLPQKVAVKGTKEITERIPGQPGSQEILEKEAEGLRAKAATEGRPLQTEIQEVPGESGDVYHQLVSKTPSEVSDETAKIAKNIPFAAPSDKSVGSQAILEAEAAKLKAAASTLGQDIQTEIVQTPDGFHQLVVRQGEATPAVPDIKVVRQLLKSEAIPESEKKILQDFMTRTIKRPNETPAGTKGDLLDLERILGDARQSGRYETSPVNQGAKQLDQLVTEKVDQAIPEYGEVRGKYGFMKKAFDALGIPEADLMQKTPEGFDRLAPDAANKIFKQFESQAKGGFGGEVAMRNLETAFDNMKQAGIEGIDQLKSDILGKAKDYVVSEYIKSGSTLPHLTGIGAFMGRSAAALGNVAGMGAKATGLTNLGTGLMKTLPRTQMAQKLGQKVTGSGGGTHTPSPTEDFSQQLYSLNDNDLIPVAQALQQDPNHSYLGKQLQQAVQTGNKQTKNALLFSIAQNPSLRKYLGK